MMYELVLEYYAYSRVATLVVLLEYARSSST